MPSPTPTPTPVPAPASVTDLELSGSYADGAATGTISWQVKNLGSMSANGLVLVQHLPTNAAIQSITDLSGGSCTQSRAIMNVMRVACRLGTLPPGQSWTVIVEAAPSASSAKVVARISFQGRDPNPANNYAIVLMPHDITSGSSGGVPLPIRPRVDSSVRRRLVSSRPLPEP